MNCSQEASDGSEVGLGRMAIVRPECCVGGRSVGARDYLAWLLAALLSAGAGSGEEVTST